MTKPATTTDDLRAAIEGAQYDLALAGDVPAMRRDPYRLVLSALSGTLSIFGRSVTRWERAVADVIAARDPLPEADKEALKAELVDAVHQAAFDGMRKEAQRMVRSLDRAVSIKIGLAVSAAFVCGIAATLGVLFVLQAGPFSVTDAWASLIRNNPDPRPALGLAEVRTDHGRRYYGGLSLWLDAAKPPNEGK